MPKRAKLTLAAAKDYVIGYYQAAEDVIKIDIEGAGLFRPEGGVQEVCGLNVVVTYRNGGKDAVRWEVFEEDDGEGGSCLRGDC
jgi:hypothetical protein